MEAARQPQGTGHSGSHDEDLFDGTTTRVGHAKNYVFMGLAQAIVADESIKQEVRQQLLEVIVNFVNDGTGRIDLNKAAALGKVVAYASTAKGQDCLYLNFRLHEEFKALEGELEIEVWTKWGVRQFDPPPPKPVTRDIKTWAEAQRGR